MHGLAWWDKNDEGKPILRAVMSKLPANRCTYYRRGTRRMGSATVVRDWHSGGFQLERSGVTDRNRFERVLLPLMIASRWLVRLGRWVVKRGYRRLIAAGTARKWHYSLFQLGIGWKER